MTPPKRQVSFRLDAETIAALDELAGRLDQDWRRRFPDGPLWEHTRSSALRRAIDGELARARAADDDDGRRQAAAMGVVRTGEDRQRWACALCGRPTAWSQFKRHLNTVHADDEKPRVDAEWRAFLDGTGWPR
jgi:predicted transcriptional regulator